MKNSTIIITAIVALSFLGVGFYITKELPSYLGATGNTEALFLQTPTHSSASLVPATSTLILAADTGYVYGRFCNTHATNNVWLAVGADAASSTGVYVAPTTCWPEDGAKVLLGGRLEGTASATTTVVYIYE